MKVVAAIPVHGRHPLVYYTIMRLLGRNGVSAVVCTGGKEDRAVCESAGAIFYEAENVLSNKWNLAFQKCRELKPDAVLFVGSSDWISDNWIPEMTKNLVGMVGKLDYWLCDIGINEVKQGYWGGYDHHREGEPIGIGRIISTAALDAIDWMPFLPNRPNSMDWMMYSRLMDKFQRIDINHNPEIYSLSISCYQWSNLHVFGNRGEAEFHECENKWLIDKHFPEIYKVQKDVQKMLITV